MSGDIVERLHELATALHDYDRDMLFEAADEIERHARHQAPCPETRGRSCEGSRAAGGQAGQGALVSCPND